MLTNPVARTMLAISVVAFPLLEARGQALWQDTTISECSRGPSVRLIRPRSFPVIAENAPCSGEKFPCYDL